MPISMFWVTFVALRRWCRLVLLDIASRYNFQTLCIYYFLIWCFNPDSAMGEHALCRHFFRWLVLHEKRRLEVRNLLSQFYFVPINFQKIKKYIFFLVIGGPGAVPPHSSYFQKPRTFRVNTYRYTLMIFMAVLLFSKHMCCW